MLTIASKTLRFISIVLALAEISACTAPPSYYRYEITVEVETPDGVVRGSTVRQIKYQPMARITQESSATAIDERGQAVMIELPNARTLFVLISTDVHDLLGLSFYWDEYKSSRSKKGLVSRSPRELLDDAKSHKRLVTLPSIGAAVDRNLNYPSMVIFEDKNIPASVIDVDPSHLSSSLGSRYSLNRITLQMTDKPITTGIEKNWSGWVHIPKNDSQPLPLRRLTHRFLSGLCTEILQGSRL